MLKLEKVVDEESEETIKASDFFLQDISKIFKQREILEQAYLKGRKLWVCPICRQPIKIRGKKDGDVSLHFYHFLKNVECPLKDDKKFTKEELLRYRYNGQKEGLRHKYLKEMIAKKLEQDMRFKDIKIEKRMHGVSDKWRLPDVSATFKNIKVVFELQLSTTFINVISERNNFYRESGIYILWIFDKNHVSVEDMRFTEKDIFFPNHHNAFFFNENFNGNNFNLTCGYEIPVIEEGRIIRKYYSKIIDFDELTFDSNYHVYYKNYDYHEKLDDLKLFEYKLSLVGKNNIKKVEGILDSNSKLLQAYNVKSPYYQLQRLLLCLLCIKHKKVIGYNYDKVVQVLHNYLETDTKRSEHFVEYLFKAIKCYNAKPFIMSEDSSGKFYSKAKEYIGRKYALSKIYDIFLKAVFPELFR